MTFQPKRILAVDDNRVILNVLSFTLERVGFHVEIARNGRAAWKLLEREDFDLVVTDYQMPEMNGEMLCRRMQETERLRNVPIILLSAKGLEFDLNRLRAEFGVSEVVFKPFSPNGLVAAVEACLNKNVGACR